MSEPYEAEESYNFSEDEAQEMDNNEPLSLEINQTFESWEEVDNFFFAYGVQQGFSLRKSRVNTVKFPDGASRITKRSFECSYSGKYKPKKVDDVTQQQQRESKAIECPWRANLNWPKTALKIKLTLFNNVHNHELDPLIHLISPKYRRFTQQMSEDVKFYVQNGGPTIGAPIIRNLLQAKYPEKYIHDKDIYNAIAKYKSNSRMIQQNFYNVLLIKK